MKHGSMTNMNMAENCHIPMPHPLNMRVYMRGEAKNAKMHIYAKNMCALIKCINVCEQGLKYTKYAQKIKAYGKET